MVWGRSVKIRREFVLFLDLISWYARRGLFRGIAGQFNSHLSLTNKEVRTESGGGRIAARRLLSDSKVGIGWEYESDAANPLLELNDND
jgi:hypothetical protein